MRPFAGNGLARAAVRFKPASFAGTFVALMMAAMIVSACGILLETGLRATVAPERYAGAPVVVAADQRAHLATGHGEDRAESSDPLPGTARLDASYVRKAAGAAGAARAIGDVTFSVRDGDRGLTAHGWGSAALTGDRLAGGAAPRSGEVVLDRAAARAAQVRTGDRIALTPAGGERDFRVAGVTAEASGDGPTAWFADRQAAALAGHPGTVDAIAVLPAGGTDAGELASAVRKALASGTSVPGAEPQVHTGVDRGAVEDPKLGYAKEMLTGLGGSFGGIATLVAVFTAAGTVALSVAQRAREFALLRAVGATPRQIRRSTATEALLVAPVAGAVGCLPGIGLAAWWFGQLKGKGAIPDAVDLSVSFVPLLVAVASGLLTALVAGWAAGRRPARIKPGQALAESSVERLRPGIVRTLLGLAALGGGVAMAGLAAQQAGEDAATASLGVVMLFMLAVALLGPLVAWACAGLFGLPLRRGGAAASLAAANSRTNARRLASAITPIVLAMAFASTLVFMHTSESHVAAKQLREGLTADHVVTHPAGLPTTAATAAAHRPGVRAAVGVLETNVMVRYGSGDGAWLQNTAAQGVSASGARLARVEDLDVRDGSLDRLGPGRVAIDRTVATSAKAGLGDRLTVYLPDGTLTHPRVVAVYGRGLGLSAITMDRASLAGHVTSAFDTALLVDGGSAAALRDLGGRVTDASGYARARDLDLELNAWANNTMAAVLGGFAAIAAVNTLVMTVLDRRRELGMLRLIGSTRTQVMRMLRWEGLLVTLAGVALGTAIATATLIPMTRGLTGEGPYIPPLLYASFAASAIALGLTAVTLPARASLRRG